MEENTVTALVQPGEFKDLLTQVLRNGAQQLLAHAVEAEVSAFLDLYSGLATAEGHKRLVRHGHLPERSVQTGIGSVPVRQPRVRDRGDGEKIRFNSSILPKYARRSRSLDALLPALYLSGISSGNLQEALSALLGKDAPNLSPAVLRKLKADWQDDLLAWQRRDLSARRYVYIWADGVYLQARMETEKQCILVIIGATPEGKKELVGFQAGYRESTQSWRELLVDLKSRGLVVPPELAIGPSRSIAAQSPVRRRMVPWAFGKPWKRNLARPSTNGAGSTRRSMFSTKCPNPSNPRPVRTSRKSGWPNPERMLKRQ